MIDKQKVLWYNTKALFEWELKKVQGPWKLNNDDEKGTRNWNWVKYSMNYKETEPKKNLWKKVSNDEMSEHQALIKMLSRDA